MRSVTLFLAPTLALIAVGSLSSPEASAQSGDIVHEAATGSVWLVEASSSGGGVASEWRADGALVRHADPFSAFNHRDPRTLISGIDNQITTFEGRFAIAASYRGHYVRGDDGAFRLEEFFRTPGAFGCNETPSTRACMVFAFVDARGEQGVYTFNELGLTGIHFWTGSGYRPATAMEGRVMSDFERETIWAPDGSYAIRYLKGGRAVAAGSFAFTVDRETGSEQKLVTLDSGAAVDGVFLRDGRLFLSTVGQSGGGDGDNDDDDGDDGDDGDDDDDTGGAPVTTSELLEIEDPLGEAPHVRSIWRHDSAPTEGVSRLGMDRTSLYLLLGTKIRSIALTDGSATEVADCPSFQTLSDSRVDALLVACGDRLLNFSEGALTWEEQTSGQASDALIIQDGRGGPREIVVRMQDGSLERLRAGRAPLRAKFKPIAYGPSLTGAWEESGRTCGLQANEQGASKVFCQDGDRWREVSSPIGSPLQVRSDGRRWWALSKIGQEWVVFSLAVGRDELWRLEQAWPASDGVIPKLLPTPTGVAVDLRGNGIWTHDGSRFVETHVGRRLPVAFNGGLDSEGNLYEVCAPGAAEYEYLLCRIRPDGSRTSLGLTVYIFGGDVYSSGSIVPLSRGVVFDLQYSDDFVIRGDRVIALSDLYGDFAIPPNGFMSVSYFSKGRGLVIVKRLKYDPSNFQVGFDYFSYDGRTLVNERTDAPRFNTGDSADIFSPSGGQMWQGIDGVWRVFQDDSPDKLSFGLTAAAAVAHRKGVAPNFVNHAMADGSRLLLATDDGIWSCATAGATLVGPTSRDLLAHRSCQRVRQAPFVKRIYKLQQDYLVEQGHQILRLTTIDDRAPRVISIADKASDLTRAGDSFTWQEAGKVIRLDGVTGAIAAAARASGNPGAAVGSWYCGPDGLEFDASGSGSWTQVAPRCQAIGAIGDQVAVVSDDQIQICRSGVCGAARALPRPFMTDSRLGSVLDASGASQFAVSLGSRLYEIDADGGAHEITPRFAGGSLLVTSPGTIENGMVSLLGGGLIALPYAAGDEHLRHVRLE